ncbi:hypothetical protein [Mucilaginibacter limnophilus]|uniref:hypothetical protein n=1 Tax=Mucilaginibacter limnophilus TaxID=1932778 RepID=UPI000FD824C4|nr:hypothetical protein [Mucilaginibacter limnophilus]
MAGELLTAGKSWRIETAAAWHDRVLLALDTLEQQINARYFGPAGDPSIRRYLRYHRTAITLLSDRMFTFLQDDIAGPTATLLKDVLQHLETAISNLGHRYPDASGSTIPATAYYRHTVLDDFQRKSALILSIFADDQTRELWTAIGYSLEELLQPSSGIRYDHAELGRISKFAELIVREAGLPTFDAHRLFRLAYMENLNTSKVAVWYQEQFLHEISRLSAAALESRFLREERRLLLHGVAPKTAFDPRRESLSDQLPAWLQKLRKQQVTDSDKTTGIARLSLELSVAQLGLFLRLCYLTGCFHEHNISALLRFVSRHFISKKQDHISLKSLAKAFYNAELSTAASNRAWLQRMIDRINQKYFPK